MPTNDDKTRIDVESKGTALSRASHLLVRKDDVICTRCLQVVPVSPGDGTPLPSFVLGLLGLLRTHPPDGNCK